MTYITNLNPKFNVFKDYCIDFNTKLKKYLYYNNFNNKIQNYCSVLGCISKKIKAIS